MIYCRECFTAYYLITQLLPYYYRNSDYFLLSSPALPARLLAATVISRLFVMPLEGNHQPRDLLTLASGLAFAGETELGPRSVAGNSRCATKTALHLGIIHHVPHRGLKSSERELIRRETDLIIRSFGLGLGDVKTEI